MGSVEPFACLPPVCWLPPLERRRIMSAIHDRLTRLETAMLERQEDRAA